MGCCLILLACNKDQVSVESTPLQQIATKHTLDGDVVYHYKGLSYALHFQEGSTKIFVEDDLLIALHQATADQELVTFQYSDHPLHHYFLFDDDFEGLDYIEQHSDALIGRKLKHAHRIDELRDRLMATYGMPLDFDNPALVAMAQAGV